MTTTVVALALIAVLAIAVAVRGYLRWQDVGLVLALIVVLALGWETR